MLGNSFDSLLFVSCFFILLLFSSGISLSVFFLFPFSNSQYKHWAHIHLSSSPVGFESARLLTRFSSLFRSVYVCFSFYILQRKFSIHVADCRAHDLCMHIHKYSVKIVHFYVIECKYASFFAFNVHIYIFLPICFRILFCRSDLFSAGLIYICFHLYLCVVFVF